MEGQRALTPDDKKAFTFPPYQQHSKCLPAAGTSFHNPLDYWVCVMERHSPQLTTYTETEDDHTRQTSAFRLAFQRDPANSSLGTSK